MRIARASRSQEVWGLRYLDDAMVRLPDKNLDGDCRDSGELFWQLDPASWGAQFSTVAVIDKNAVLRRRMCSTSYGVGTHRWPHEVNNTDGVIDSGDMSLFTAMGGAKWALAIGLISDPNGPDNVFGYDGYVYNPDQGLGQNENS